MCRRYEGSSKLIMFTRGGCRVNIKKPNFGALFLQKHLCPLVKAHPYRNIAFNPESDRVKKQHWLKTGLNFLTPCKHLTRSSKTRSSHSVKSEECNFLPLIAWINTMWYITVLRESGAENVFVPAKIQHHSQVAHENRGKIPFTYLRYIGSFRIANWI